jgi:hypothetical protein
LLYPNHSFGTNATVSPAASATAPTATSTGTEGSKPSFPGRRPGAKSSTKNRPQDQVFLDATPLESPKRATDNGTGNANASTAAQGEVNGTAIGDLFRPSFVGSVNLSHLFPPHPSTVLPLGATAMPYHYDPVYDPVLLDEDRPGRGREGHYYRRGHSKGSSSGSHHFRRAGSKGRSASRARSASRGRSRK